MDGNALPEIDPGRISTIFSAKGKLTLFVEEGLNKKKVFSG
jgi:hypothetical protein